MSHIGSKIDPSIPVLIGIKFPVMTRHQGAQYVVKILSVEVESYIGQRLSGEFKMKDLRDVEHFFGTSITGDPWNRSISIDQIQAFQFYNRKSIFGYLFLLAGPPLVGKRRSKQGLLNLGWKGNMRQWRTQQRS